MKKIIVFLGLTLLIVPMLALGADFRADDDLNIDVAVPEDLYAAGGELSLSKAVNGDVSVAGGEITIDSVIQGDLNVIGGTVRLSGEVNGDVRIAGGEVFINAIIREDLIIASGDVEITANSSVGGDLVMGTGAMTLDGTVNGDVWGGAGEMKLNGKVRGQMNLKKVDQLSFGPNAEVEGDLTYRANTEQLGFNEKVGGSINFTQSEWRNTKGSHQERAFGSFQWFGFLSLLFAGLFYIWLLRFYASGSLQQSKTRPFMSFLVGFLVVFATPVVALFFAVLVLGLPVAYILFLSWLMALYVAKLASATLIGFLLVKPDVKKASFLKLFLAFALGAFLFTLLRMLPAPIGWAAQWLVAFVAIGGVAMYEYELYQTLRKKNLI